MGDMNIDTCKNVERMFAGTRKVQKVEGQYFPLHQQWDDWVLNSLDGAVYPRYGDHGISRGAVFRTRAAAGTFYPMHGRSMGNPAARMGTFVER
jgi:hypothetical protein